LGFGMAFKAEKEGCSALKSLPAGPIVVEPLMLFRAEKRRFSAVNGKQQESCPRALRGGRRPRARAVAGRIKCAQAISYAARQLLTNSTRNQVLRTKAKSNAVHPPEKAREEIRARRHSPKLTRHAARQ
jgi:hypothetical protein